MTHNGGPRPGDTRLAADVVLFTKQDGVLSVLAVERGKEPFRAALALPGGFVEPGERASDAAVRELAEETGIAVDRGSLRRLGYYREEGRDPRGHVASVAFHGYEAGAPAVVGGSDARAARWVPVADFLSTEVAVAFDHRDIVRDALVRRFDWRPASAEADAASPGAAGRPARGGRARRDVRRRGSSAPRSGPGTPRPR